MTPTSKQVSRITVAAYPCKTGLTGTGYGKPRRIVATLMAGDILMLRWHGTRQREYVGIKDVMAWATRTRAMSERAQKLNAKRRTQS